MKHQRKRWTQEGALELRRLRETMTLQEIGDMHGISRQRVEQIFQEKGIPPAPRVQGAKMRAQTAEGKVARTKKTVAIALRKRNRATKKRLILDACLTDYIAGEGYEGLAERYGMNITIIADFIHSKGEGRTRKEGCAIRVQRKGVRNGPQSEVNKRNTLIIDDYLLPMSPREVALKHGMRAANVRRIVVKAGVGRSPQEARALRTKRESK